MFKKISAVILVTIFISCSQQESVEKKLEPKKDEYIESVRKNLFVGEIVGIYYSSFDTTVIISGDPAGGAVVGGGAAALVGFGPLGIILGAAIGADAEKTQTKQIGEDKLILLMSSGDDTLCFKILERNPSRTLDVNRVKFAKKSPPSLSQIAFYTNLGSKIYIPTSTPLSRFAKIYSDFVYFKRGEIPHIN